MARYIDADKQIERYSKKLGFYIDEEGEDRFSAKCEEIRAAISALYNAPTADVVEVVHAQWNYWDGWIGCHDQRIEGATCSNCGYEHPTVKGSPELLSNYCGGCGAKMDGKKVE